MEKLSRVRLGAIAAGTMAIATFPLIAFSVLASDLIEEFGVNRAQVGLLVTATGLVGALASPYFGYLTDRVGAVRATRATFTIGAVALAGLAVSPAYAILLFAAFVAGLANGWGNPATNALIVDNIPPGSRGVVTGIKQSGVQVGTFLAGLLLPVFAELWGWRVALGLFVVVPLAGLVSMAGIEGSNVHHRHLEGERGSVPLSVKWIAVYGTISGISTSAMLSFLPLFAEEDQGWSPPSAGLLVALIGFTGVVARISWPSVAERFLGHGRTLRLLAGVSSISAVLATLAALKVAPSWVLVPAALLLAAGAIAWNAVGMLAVMDLAGPGVVGRGTGLVLLGFLLGYSAGAPLMGLSVDALGSYAPGWAVAALLLITASVVAGRVPAGSTLTTP